MMLRQQIARLFVKPRPVSKEPRTVAKRNEWFNLKHELYQLYLFDHWLYCRDTVVDCDWAWPPTKDLVEDLSTAEMLEKIKQLQKRILEYENLPENVRTHRYVLKDY